MWMPPNKYIYINTSDIRANKITRLMTKMDFSPQKIGSS